MAIKNQIFELVAPLVTQAGLVLEEVQVHTPGKHRFVTVIIDSETGLNLDKATEVSRLIGEAMDNATFMGVTPYTLEVTSPGVDRPLTAPRHWRKNVDRLVNIIKLDGQTCKGRITNANEDEVILDCCTLAYSDIKRAIIEVEFSQNAKKANKSRKESK